MQNIVVRPSICLSNYAQEHLNELKFESNEEFPHLEKNLQIKASNWLTRNVRKIDALLPSIAKVALICALFITVIVTPFAIGIPVIGLGIPFIAFCYRENILYKKEEKDRLAVQKDLDKQVDILNTRAEIVKKLGLSNFKHLPILDLQGKSGATDYIDFLRPDDLSAPIMKGIDKFRRPFIALKLTTDETNAKPFVITVFQRYTNDSIWENGQRSYDIDRATINFSVEGKIFYQIIHGTHPTYHLAI